MRLLIVLCLLLLNVSAQDYFPALQQNDFNNFVINKTKEFDGNSLWGHIDGGADLYLEYGFDKLLFQDVEFKGVNFRVEFYRMKDEKSAFGIFSINRFRCNKSDTLTKFICITDNQIQSALGRFYISISNEKETDEALQLSFVLFNKILSRSNEQLFNLPEIFESEKLRPFKENMKFIKGALGFQNGFPLWESMFSEFDDYSLFLLPVENDSGYVNLAEIEFANQNDLINFLKSLDISSMKVGELVKTTFEEQFLQVKRESENKLLYEESDHETRLLN